MALDQITARDVVGTAHSNAALATKRLADLVNGRQPSYMSREDILSEVANDLNKALGDVMLARHQLSMDWEPATYLGIWEP